MGMFWLTLCDKGEVSDTTPDSDTVNDVENPSKNSEKNEEMEDASLTELRKVISDNDAELGIAYLGYNSGGFDDIKKYLDEASIYELYPFAKDVDGDSFYSTENSELYLVVPAESTTVEIYSGVLNEEEYQLEKNELVGKAENGKPFLLGCNVSEVIPNVILSVGDFEYVPFISGMDGRLVPNDEVYDFSPYELIMEYFGVEIGEISDGESAAFCGFWMGEAEDGDYVVNTLSLTLSVDGTAEYIYGIGNSEPTEGFEGTWSYDANRDMILLDMYGTPFDDSLDSDEKYADPRTIECGFKWYIDYRDDGKYLVLTHEEGDTILWGKNGATFELYDMSVSDDYTYLIGSWGVISEIKETYLEIFDNGDAHYYVVSDGTTEKDFYGTWTAEALTLSLNLYEYSGNSGIIGEPAVFFGEYGISYDGEFLTLSLIAEATEPLTAFMEENGYEQFILCGVG